MDAISTFNLGSGKTYKIKDIALMIKEIMNIPSVTFIFEGKPRKGDFMMNWADISNTITILDWKPQTDIKTGLKVTIEWYSKNLMF
jgi:nucleoside-diphosphate-sugar epimerase